MGYLIVFNRDATQVGTLNGKIVRADATRKKLVFLNESLGQIDINPYGGSIRNAQVFNLPPRSGTVEVTADEDGDLCTSEWWGGSDDGIATHAIVIMEVLEITS
jgi:hypothetical protein